MRTAVALHACFNLVMLGMAIVLIPVDDPVRSQTLPHPPRALKIIGHEQAMPSNPASIEQDQPRTLVPHPKNSSVRSDHPRLFVTSDDLPELRQRAPSQYKDDLDVLRQSSAGVAQAMVYLATEDLGAAKKAITVALQDADRMEASGPSQERSLSQRIFELGLMYDWLYPVLSKTQRQTIRAGLVRGINWMDCRDVQGRQRPCGKKGPGPHNTYISNPRVWDSHNTEVSGQVLPALLAMQGDFTTAESELRALAEQRTMELLNHYRDNWWCMFEKTMADEGGWWMGMMYNGTNIAPHIDALAALTTATGENWFERLPFFENHIYFMIYTLTNRERGVTMMIEDMSFPYYRDGHYSIALLISYFYQNGHARWLADQMESQKWLKGSYHIFHPQKKYMPYVYKLLFRHHLPESTPPDDLPLNGNFGASGNFFIREGWNPSDVVMFIKSLPYYSKAHNSLSNGHFSIYKRGLLALDSGFWDSSTSKHHTNYSETTIAHNTVLMGSKDAQEPRDKGNQFRPGLSNAHRVNPFETNHATNTYYATRHEVYLKIDMTKAYRKDGYPPKWQPQRDDICELCLRRFVYLRNVANWPEPIIVVADHLQGTKVWDKAWLLHTEERPSVNGDTILHTDQDGKLFIKVLQSETMTIRLVGGSGKEFTDWSGRNWPVEEKISWTAPYDRGDVALGTWRVEISPKRPAVLDRFLTVMAPTDKSFSHKPKVGEIQNQHVIGVMVQDQVVLFPSEAEHPLNDFTYTLPDSDFDQYHHFVADMIPYGIYGVNGQTYTASREGTLKFSMPHVGRGGYHVTYSGRKADRVTDESWYHPVTNRRLQSQYQLSCGW